MLGLKFMRASRVGAIAALVMAMTSTGTAHAQLLIGRVVYSDFAKPEVGVIDVESGKVSRIVRVAAKRARLASSSDGRFVFVATGEAKSRVQALDTGVLLEPHDDHWHIEKRPSRLLDFVATGTKASHIVSGYGYTSIFFDGKSSEDGGGGARAVLVDHARLAKNRSIMAVWPSPARQHGMAVPLGAPLWAMTSPDVLQPPGVVEMPSGLHIVDASRSFENRAILAADGREGVQCEGIHGHTTMGELHAFGCRGGNGSSLPGALLFLERKGDGLEARNLPYPDHQRVNAIKARSGGRYMVAAYGEGDRFNAFLRIDPQAKRLDLSDIWAPQDISSTCQFEISGNGRHVVNLLGDGTLRVYEISPVWKEVGRVVAVPAFDCGVGSTGPRPSLGIVADSALVTDPTNRRIRRYDIASLALLTDWLVKGMPEGLATGSATF
jgi:hypothetical protein